MEEVGHFVRPGYCSDAISKNDGTIKKFGGVNL
jgi:hypothetical protein